MQILPTVILHGGGDEAQPGGLPAPLWLHLAVAACASGKSTSPIVNVIAVAAVITAMKSIVEAFIMVDSSFIE